MLIQPKEITVDGKSFLLEERLRHSRKRGTRIFHGRSVPDDKEVLVKTYELTDMFFHRAKEAYEIFKKIRTQLLALGIPDFIACEDKNRVTEYVPGLSLSEVHSAIGGMHIEEVRDFFMRALPYLEAFKDAGVQHGDIKPDNFVRPMTESERKKYIASREPIDIMEDTKPIDPEMMHRIGDWNNNAFGTAYYMAPEIVHFKQYQPTTDLFSLGMSGLDLLGGRSNHIKMGRYIRTGKTAYEIFSSRKSGDYILPKGRKRLTDRLLRQFPKDRTMVMQVTEFAFQCLEKDPAARPQTLVEQRQILGDTGNLSEI